VKDFLNSLNAAEKELNHFQGGIHAGLLRDFSLREKD
jgi:hypothetical protein